jgi:PGF-pre-PGF domain-containing protein
MREGLGIFRLLFVGLVLFLGSVGSASAAVSCGDTITVDTTLDSDLICTGDGITIDANNITLDGAGYSITGDGSGSGVSLNGRSNVTVKNLTVSGFDIGIYLMSSSGSTLEDNTASNNNGDGISLNSSSSGNAITGNTASNNKGGGIYLESSGSNTITGNTASGNYLEGIGLYLSSSNTIYGNIVSGNSKTRSMSYGGIALLNSTGNTITGNGVSNEECDGIALWDSSDSNTITSNMVSNGKCGGIYLYNSGSNGITGNTLSNNNWEGISLNSSSNDNIIKDNTASGNGKYGIYLESSSSNEIHNNKLENNNVNNAYDDGTNAWNTAKTPGTNIIGGSWLGGNYYSDYTGSDADGDGIGDSSYDVPGGSSKDNLPLVGGASPTTTTTTITTTTTTTTTTLPDTAPPGITGVSPNSITTFSAKISWSTDESANSTVYYGKTISTTSTKSSSSFVEIHSITLDGLSSGTTYYFNVSSCDVAGNCKTSPQYNFTTDSEGNGGNGGGGGGGGGGSATSFEAWINDVPAGQTFSLDIDDEDIQYINGLSLTAKQAIYSSKLAITDLDKKPYYGMEEPNASVFRYFKVNYDKDNSVESASLRFSIKKSWLKSNDVDPYTFSLYRFTNAWKKLDTKILKDDSENVYFEAATPAFSYFSLGGANGSGYRAIVNDEGETPSVTTTTTLEPTTTTIATGTPAPGSTSAPPATTKPPKGENGGVCGPTAVLLISMLSLLAFRNVRLKRK